MAAKKPATQTAPAKGGLKVADAPSHPTVEEARAMFEARPDLSSVMTEDGELFRDGSFGARKTLGLDGVWR
jgi:hypothetical protein